MVNYTTNFMINDLTNLSLNLSFIMYSVIGLIGINKWSNIQLSESHFIKLSIWQPF